MLYMHTKHCLKFKIAAMNEIVKYWLELLQVEPVDMPADVAVYY